jgi:type I restriction enzyme M protein
MLDTATKRRIDSARDILVGKVPDPKSQVEQITIALIYKFMDDMDAEAEELGGKRKFFTGDFTRYGWAKLMSAGIGGHELIGLYSEGIASMPQNPGIPALFRDIFKNAYLPYRDPETLKSFLKIIDEFSYDHSERLGDAYEYLLSILGSQGDAGQFRTPRHIIDFIVEILDPKKNETMGDTACGTAGFLISAYKHVLKHNSKDYQPAHQADAEKDLPLELLTLESPLHYKGDLLTPDERKQLAGNIKGYDISPDMVRMSLVNLYLHGFNDPHIFEYDTLTSEERWDENFDVIFANPPFMSPKGGIKPHKRFSIQAKRSEVLFVDYIAEHLTPSGRAGIIVPEGIIFQSQTAYKALRKMLVESSLLAVISLPAGVFQPYSGVKTSILILDKSLAKHSDSIAFFKIDNDGFGLGAQRRAVAGEQLTSVLAGMKDFVNYLDRDTQDLQDKSKKSGLLVLDELISLGTALIVPKEKIAANGDYNLSGERYREGVTKNHIFPLIRIGDVCTVNPRKSQLAAFKPDTPVSFVPMADINEYRMAFQPIQDKLLSEVSASYTYFEDNDVLLAKVTPCFENGKAGIARLLLNGVGFGSSEFYVLRSNGQVLPEWIYFCVMHPFFRDAAVAQMTGTGGLQRVPRDYVENFQIPLPPLEMQKEIVAEIESYQKVINGAQAVLDNYRPYIYINPDWPQRSLVSLAINLDSRRIPITKGDRKEGPYPYYGASGVVDYVADYIFDEEILLISEDGANLLARSTPIAFAVSGKCWVNNHAHVLKFPHPATQKFVEVYLNSISIEQFVTGAAQPKVNQQALNSIPIPLPDDISTQQAIAAEIEAEQALVAANHELITRFEKKIQATLARIWGEEEPIVDSEDMFFSSNN